MLAQLLRDRNISLALSRSDSHVIPRPQTVEVLFDVRSAPFSSWFSFVPLTALSVGALVQLVRSRRAFREMARGTQPRSGLVALVALVAIPLMSVGQAMIYRSEKAEFVEILHTNRAQVVEGEISEYRTQNWTGKPMESFQLGTVHFSFDGFGSTPAYHRRSLSGGPLRNGLRVRVFDYRGNILRVESIATDSAAP